LKISYDNITFSLKKAGCISICGPKLKKRLIQKEKKAFLNQKIIIFLEKSCYEILFMLTSTWE